MLTTLVTILHKTLSFIDINIMQFQYSIYKKKVVVFPETNKYIVHKTQEHSRNRFHNIFGKQNI